MFLAVVVVMLLLVVTVLVTVIILRPPAIITAPPPPQSPSRSAGTTPPSTSPATSTTNAAPAVAPSGETWTQAWPQLKLLTMPGGNYNHADLDIPEVDSQFNPWLDLDYDNGLLKQSKATLMGTGPARLPPRRTAPMQHGP